MPKTLTLHGVPHAIARDGWWLDATPDGGAPPGGAGGAPGVAGHLPRATGLLALVLLADLLFWRHAPGLSVAVFAIAVFAAATADVRPRRALIRPGLFLGFGVAPVIDHLQLLSLVFLVATLLGALVWARHPGVGAGRLAVSALTLLRRLPGLWIMPLRAAPLRRLAAGLRPARWLRDWAFPLGGSLVIAALLLDANPMLLRLVPVEVDLWAMIERGMFWLGIALLVAPLLHPDLPLGKAMDLSAPQRLPGFGINARSVLRALVPFNLLIGVQMVTDAAILIGGAALPPGMSFAEYAHRGAYPLLATAVLAGAFALAARPFLEEHRLIRGLLLLWLAQNVVLCGAAAMRLELYVGAYGLTYLRLHALIWMALVAAGLGLIGWQILWGRENGWLVGRVGVMGLATLYACSFVNFAQVIATQQLGRDEPDFGYVCDLGPMAAGAVHEAPSRHAEIAAWVEANASRWREVDVLSEDESHCHALNAPYIHDWRDWGFRRWLVIRRVQAAEAVEYTHEDPDRR
jgi:hypothetical protein